MNFLLSSRFTARPNVYEGHDDRSAPTPWARRKTPRRDRGYMRRNEGLSRRVSGQDTGRPYVWHHTSKRPVVPRTPNGRQGREREREKQLCPQVRLPFRRTFKLGRESQTSSPLSTPVPFRVKWVDLRLLRSLSRH